MTTVLLIINVLSVTLTVAALMALDMGRISRATAYAVWTATNVNFAICALLSGDRVQGLLAVAVAAWCAYQWWHGDGGDNTRRRLKSWASRFQGVRRTAPSHA